MLIDTVDQLPGLLPLHAWQALSSSVRVLVGSPDHPLTAHLDAADLAWETVERDPKAIVDRVAGQTAYLYGAADDAGFTRGLGLEAARRLVELEIVYFAVAPPGLRLLDLVRTQERLLAPDGCPWDREQTHESLARYAQEEVAELVDAIATGDPDHIREELGDVLMQVTFHAQLAAAAGTFDIDDVAGGIVDKLVRRHPHVFADATADTADQVIARWDELKADEKPERTGPLDGVPRSLPALAYARELQARAAKAGLAVELEGDDVAARLWRLVAEARAQGVDPELALRAAAAAFRDPHEALPDP